MDLNGFLRESVKLIDQQDIERELSGTKQYYAKEMLAKDIEIASMDKRSSGITKLTKESHRTTNEIKNKLNDLVNQLSLD